MLLTEGLTRRGDEAPAGAADQPRRAVIDTNALLDWLVFHDEAALTLGAAIRADHLVWLATPRLLDELRLVLARPLPDRWELARKHALTIDVMPLLTMCESPTTGLPSLTCRDGSDQVFIDLALQRAPCWLITRDRALLALRRRAAAAGVRVGTPAQWRQQTLAGASP